MAAACYCCCCCQWLLLLLLPMAAAAANSCCCCRRFAAALTQLSDLRVLSLSGNCLTGNIPSSFGESLKVALGWQSPARLPANSHMTPAHCRASGCFPWRATASPVAYQTRSLSCACSRASGYRATNSVAASLGVLLASKASRFESCGRAGGSAVCSLSMLSLSGVTTKVVAESTEDSVHSAQPPPSTRHKPFPRSGPLPSRWSEP